MQSTDKMGSGSSNSVVSRDFRVWGTEGLYVVDGSIFPTSIGANPMQSIYTFAKIFADRLAPANGSGVAQGVEHGAGAPVRRKR